MHTSTAALAAIGCTYRQLDYLTRCGAVPEANPGPGGRREWTTDQVGRLAVAYRLAACGAGSAFPDIARAALDAAPAPRSGYAVYGPEGVSWAATWADLRRVIDGGAPVAVVAYDLDALLADLPELAHA